MAIVIPDALLDAIMDPKRPAVFFLGAGNSMDSNLPSAGELAKVIRAGLPATHQAAIQEWETRNNKPAGLEHIADICRTLDGNQRRFIDLIPRDEWLDAEPHEGHIILAQLWAEKLVGEPFTTNLDTLIEKGFQKALVRRLPGCFRIEHFKETVPPRVYKVHGCLTEPYGTIWAASDLERKDWDEAWKNFATGKEMLESSAFIFVGFRMALPYLKKTFEEAGKPKAFMVNKPTFDEFQAEPQHQAFLQAFNIGQGEYVSATSKTFFEELRLRVQDRILHEQLCDKVPRMVADLELPLADLQTTGQDLLGQLNRCSPTHLQTFLKRSLLGNTYIGLRNDTTSHLLRGLFLLRVAYPIEVRTDMAEPTCYLVTGNDRIPIFFAFGEDLRSRAVVATWQAKANRDWPGDMKSLLIRPPLVLVFGQGDVANPVGLPNIATGKPVPGPYGPEPKFNYLSYHDLVNCIEPDDFVATAHRIGALVQRILGGAQP